MEKKTLGRTERQGKLEGHKKVKMSPTVESS